MLSYLIERMRAVPAIDDVVIATTRRPVDDALADFCREQGVRCYRGATANVLGRLLHAARACAADMVVRANGDNPLLAPEYTAGAIEQCMQQEVGLVTGKTVYTGIPMGLAPEVITIEMLERLSRVARTRDDLEHVTLYALRNPSEFAWQPLRYALPDPEAIPASGLKFSVDTAEDFNWISGVIGGLRAATGTLNSQTWTVRDILRVASQTDRALVVQ